ncbi:hypothetical protein G6M89_21735 [Natronolimnobius sp. AArcel1]|uniref:hypothetical protein n=1 Tax=Natronolimnobius sp. AArcel1 TaxID=1679093 RepID=UPI0013ECA84D|nr:hypothetical protein [Natronolimnobius sp. AArcel1]NGM71569.1 hypothetical protein [Natronolimnobius sp. AArcel1]
MKVLDEKREQEREALEELAEQTSDWWIDAFADGDKRTSRDWDVCEEQVDQMLEEFGEAPESVDPPTGELVLDSDYPVNAIVDLDIDEETTATKLWSELLKRPRVQTAFIDGIRQFATGLSMTELGEKLEQYNVAYDLRAVIQRYARGLEHEDESELDSALRELLFSQQEPKGLLYLAHRLGTQRALTEQLLGTARLLGWSDNEQSETPTLAFRFNRSFEEKDRKRRETVVKLVQAISHHCEVVIVSKPIDLRWFQKDHGLEPTDFSERWTGRRWSGEIEDVVKRAMDAYDEQPTAKAILRTLHTDAGGALTYDELISTIPSVTTKGAISQWITTREDSLIDLSMVDAFRAHGRLHVELTAAGRETIETIDAETARQQRLDDFFSDVSDSPDHGRENPPAHEAPPDGDPRRKGTGYASVGSLSRRRAFGALSSSRSNAFSLADYPVEKADDYRCPQIWIDPSGDRVVTSAEYVNPLQYWVSTARALTDPRIFEWLLSEDRLESSDHDFSNLFYEHRQVLRSSRCLGELPDKIKTTSDYADALMDARDELTKLTTRLHNDNFDDEASFRGTIVCNALGLVGTVVHIMDLVDVDIVREVRLPTFSQDFDSERWDALVKTMAVGSAIQSKYAQFSAFRQLFETRQEKLDWTIFADVDADDPFGELIGSFVLVGDFAYQNGEKYSQFVEDLRSELRNPRDSRDDAPEFNVKITLWAFEFERKQFEQAADLILSEKNLSPTADPVSLLCLFSETPYDAVEALDGLKTETKHPGRSIRVDEIRFALAKETFSANRICPWLGAAGQDFVKVLLEATEPLSVTEICNRAGRDRSTWYDYVDELKATGLLTEDDGGWRLAIIFRDDEHHTSGDVVPWYIGDDDSVLLQDVLWEAAEILVDTERIVDPDDPVFGVFFDAPINIDRLRRSWSWGASWIDPIRAATGAPKRRPHIMTFGPTLEQVSIQQLTETRTAAPS